MAFQRFTHLATIYGIKCYYNEVTQEIKGTTYFNDLLIAICIWLDVAFWYGEEGFKVKLIERL